MKSETPKVLHSLAGLPLIVHGLSRAVELGANPCVVVVGFGGSEVEMAVKQHHSRVACVMQREQLGTGHATLQTRDALRDFSGAVLIMPGDAPLLLSSTLAGCLHFHRSTGSVLTVISTRLEVPASYGRIVRDVNGLLERIVEAKDADAATLKIDEVNSGIYVVERDFLFSALDRVNNQNAQAEYYLTDIVAIARADQIRVSAYCHGDSRELSGINDRMELAVAEEILQERMARDWMKRGVTLVNPKSIWLDIRSELSPDVIIQPEVLLRGRCRIEKDVCIDAGAVLTDVHVGAGARIGAHCVVEGGVVEAGTIVAPLTFRPSA